MTWCLVGEPSKVLHQLGDIIKMVVGFTQWVLTVKGKQGHVAYPHLPLT